MNHASLATSRHPQERFGEVFSPEAIALEFHELPVSIYATLSDMHGVPGNCHPLHVERAGEFAVDLRGPYRLIFEPDHKPVPRLHDGGIDTQNVTNIRIKEVDDYHGK